MPTPFPADWLRGGGLGGSGTLRGRDLCLLCPQASPVRADCGASAGRWVCLGWSFCSAETPWFPAWAAPIPGPFFLLSVFPCLSQEAFLGSSGFSGSLGVPSRIPLGVEHFVMPAKPSASWSRQLSGSDAYWDKKKAALRLKPFAEVGAEPRCPGFQPL